MAHAIEGFDSLSIVLYFKHVVTEVTLHLPSVEFKWLSVGIQFWVRVSLLGRHVTRTIQSRLELEWYSFGQSEHFIKV